MKTVIFDFDGTLADSFTLILEIAYELTKHSVLKDKNKLQKLRELGLIEVVKQLKIPKYRWPVLLFRGRRIMNRRISEVTPVNGIQNCLKILQDNKIPVFIMSSNSQKNIELFLTSNDLKKYITKIYGGVGLFNKAKAFKKILRENNFSSSEIVYIGDEPRDIEASKVHNIKCIAVSWGFNTRAVLEKHKPYNVVDNISELTENILSL